MQVGALGVNVKRKVHVSQLSPSFSQTLPQYTVIKVHLVTLCKWI